MNKRKEAMVNFVVLSKKLQIRSFDSLPVLELRPATTVGLQLWAYHLKGMNNNLSPSIYFKLLVAHFVSQLAKTSEMKEIVRTEFSNLSSSKKTSLITSSLINYLKHNDVSTRNRVGGYIALTNQQTENSHVMKSALHRIFSQGGKEKYSYPDLLKSLNLFQVFHLQSQIKKACLRLGIKLSKPITETKSFFLSLLRKSIRKQSNSSICSKKWNLNPNYIQLD